MQEGIKELENEMLRIKATLDEKTKEVEEGKRAASKAAKALEQAEKEISSRVRAVLPSAFALRLVGGLMIISEIRTTKLRGWDSSARAYTANVASRRLSYRWSLEISRTSLWRRCVVAPFPAVFSFSTACWQNLREEVAMDVDEGEEGDTTQHLKKVPDYRIEVDFDILGSDEREVSAFNSDSSVPLILFLRMGWLRHLCRTPLAKSLVNLKPQ